MKRKDIFGTLFTVFCLLFSVDAANAQFGKNKIVYEDGAVQFYQSEHADYYHWVDIGEKSEVEHLAQVVDQVERSYNFLSEYLGHELTKRPNVVFYRTQSTFAGTRLVGDLPSGVLAFAFPTITAPTRYILAIKLDLSLAEYNATITHEMAHIFQFDMGPNIFQQLMGNSTPQWIIEGGAEFLANEYEGSRTDDLRESIRRGAGANPEKDLPTWFVLNQGAADPYTFGPMTLQFIKEKYGENIVREFLVRTFNNGKEPLDILIKLTKGAVRSAEQFDEIQRDYWREKFGPEMFSKPRPPQENEYFRGRHVAPERFPNPVISAVVSPDGDELAMIMVSPEYGGLVVAVMPALSRDIEKYIEPEPELSEDESENSEPPEDPWNIEILTPYLPPKHFEEMAYDISASNLSWVKTGEQDLVAFFALSGRDNKLFIVERHDHENIRSFNIPYDYILSPALSSDGLKAYFVASENMVRDVYEFDLVTGLFTNLTRDGAYDESPALSPDGSKIVYVSFKGSFRKLFLFDLETEEKRQLTFNAFNDHAPSFSADGRTVVYTSDEHDGVSNIHTIDIKTGLASRWTDFFGRSFTPRFAGSENDRIYYTHLWQYDQYGSFIGTNWELFELLAKKPYSRYVMRDEGESYAQRFIPDRDLVEFELDENQLLNPTSAPEKWSCGGGGVSIGASTYWGMVGQGFVRCSNLLGTKAHFGQFAQYWGSRIIDYAYLNQEGRVSWLWGANQSSMPLSVQFYDILKRWPNQYILNQTWADETSFELATRHPIDKFNRFELYSRLRHRSFDVFGVSQAVIDLFPNAFTDDDKQLFKFFRDATGSNLVFGGAYVRDTILYSGNTWGAFHGNALRAQIEYAPTLGQEFQGYVSADVSARMYHRLGAYSLVAGRIELMANSRANGDFMLLCGPERLRGCEYGSMIGNQIAYGSVELRFPVPATYLLGQGFRGFLFADAGAAKFSGEVFPSRKLATYGIGLQYTIPPIIPYLGGLPAQTVWTVDDRKLIPTTYITFQW